MKNAPILPFGESNRKKCFNGKGKVSVVVNKTMLNMYKNNIFPTLPCTEVEIYNFHILYPCIQSLSIDITSSKVTQHFVRKTILHVKSFFLAFLFILNEVCLNKTCSKQNPDGLDRWVGYGCKYRMKDHWHPHTHTHTLKCEKWKWRKMEPLSVIDWRRNHSVSSISLEICENL